jgi:hypothetical protein
MAQLFLAIMNLQKRRYTTKLCFLHQKDLIPEYLILAGGYKIKHILFDSSVY